jgi:hypothetical protein
VFEHTIGDSTSVAQRFGSENGAIRPEELLNVTCFNNTGAQGDGGSLFLQVHEIAPGAAGAVVPAEGSVPKFSFPVFSKIGGMLGQRASLTGIYCCWSSTGPTKTIAAASGWINIIVKG